MIALSRDWGVGGGFRVWDAGGDDAGSIFSNAHVV